MADIVMKVTSAADPSTITIEGESTLTNYTNQITAVAMRDLVMAPTSRSRTYVAEMFLTRHRDKASPKLAQACAAGENIGTVVITLLNEDSKRYLEYTLNDTFVSRIEQQTAEANGGAYMEHTGWSSWGGSGHQGVLNAAGLTMNDDRSYSRQRAGRRPYFPLAPTPITNDEVERIWLNAGVITWTYTPYVAGVAQGAVASGWNMLTNAAV